MEENLIRKGLSIFEKSKNTIIASIDKDGFPNLKAMLKPRENEELKVFYFSTNTSSQRVKQFSENSKSSIYFFDSLSFRGIMLTGIMEVLFDQTIKDRIWRDGDTMYYSEGVTDPDYCVLKFTTKKCRMYEEFKSYDFMV
ncbi:MAG TPA: pyridoxamine 5'-phosphate oxidase family protein [Spirochaetota bacterium]|nr:pyridoxamine 5'-phosphate oxidase family protein [Spirochaetota bacterium]